MFTFPLPSLPSLRRCSNSCSGIEYLSVSLTEGVRQAPGLSYALDSFIHDSLPLVAMPDKCPEGIEEKLWQAWHDLKRDDVIWLAQYNHVSIDPKANKGPIIEKLIRSKTDLPTPAEFAKLKGAVTAHQDHTHASRLAQWNKVPDSLLTTAIWVLCKERLPKFYRMKPDQARDVLACQFDALNPEILTTITPPADLKTYTNSHPQHVAPNTSAPTSTTSDQAAEAKKKVTSDVDEVDPPQSPADDDEGGALQTGPSFRLLPNRSIPR